MPKAGKDKAATPTALESVEVAGFTLLNNDKVQRALDILGEDADEESLLATYDKLGGGIKKDGRKIAIGSFWDFEEKKAKTKVDYEKLDYEEEYVLVRKPLETKGSKGPSTKDRVAKLGSKKGEVKAKAEPAKAGEE